MFPSPSGLIWISFFPVFEEEDERVAYSMEVLDKIKFDYFVSYRVFPTVSYTHLTLPTKA